MVQTRPVCAWAPRSSAHPFLADYLKHFHLYCERTVPALCAAFAEAGFLTTLYAVEVRFPLNVLRNRCTTPLMSIPTLCVRTLLRYPAVGWLEGKLAFMFRFQIQARQPFVTLGLYMHDAFTVRPSVPVCSGSRPCSR